MRRFHDGSQDTLWDVMDYYNHGDGIHNPYLDEDIQSPALSEGEIDDVVGDSWAWNGRQVRNLRMTFKRRLRT